MKKQMNLKEIISFQRFNIFLLEKKMTKREYPKEISQDEWLKRQNYFLEEQNKRLKIELSESKEYINVLINKLKLYQSKQ